MPFLFPVFPNKPPLAHTGGFGEPTCRACHFDNQLNDTGGQLTVAGVPEQFKPDSSYQLTITLSRPGMGRAGFQLAARKAAGPAAGEQAGWLAATDEKIEVADSVMGKLGRIQYARHTHAGSDLVARDSASWTLQWKAPTAAAGAVAFHVVANAASDDASELGDFIYTTSVSTRP